MHCLLQLYVTHTFIYSHVVSTIVTTMVSTGEPRDDSAVLMRVVRNSEDGFLKFSVSNRSMCGFVYAREPVCHFVCVCVWVYGWGLSCGKRPEQEADFHIGNFTIFYYTQKKGRKKKRKNPKPPNLMRFTDTCFH